MQAVDVYLMYCALKAHFGKGDYDFVKYGGKSSATKDSFWKRTDRLFFVKTQRKYKKKQVIQDYLVSNFVQNTKGWLGDFNDDISEEMTNNVFAEFLNNPESYFFTDTYIAEGSSLNWSFPSYPSHLDHILVTNELFIDTINTFTIQLDNYMIGGFQKYDNHISDHRPVGINL